MKRKCQGNDFKGGCLKRNELNRVKSAYRIEAKRKSMI